MALNLRDVKIGSLLYFNDPQQEEAYAYYWIVDILQREHYLKVLALYIETSDSLRWHDEQIRYVIFSKNQLEKTHLLI